MTTRLGIAGMVAYAAASGGCFAGGGFGTSASAPVAEPASDDAPSTGAFHITTTGYKPTNDIESIALRQGIRAVKKELATMQERCGVTIPVEIMYAAPMKTWIGAEGWGNHRGCTHEAEHGGCINLSLCGGEVVSMIWFNLCGGPGEGTKREYRGWNTKVKKLVCRGEASPPETSAAEHEHSKSAMTMSDDGTLTVTVHPSDANVSYDFGAYLEALVQAE